MMKLETWLLHELLNNDIYRPSIKEYGAGEAIFRIGDHGDFLAVLLKGSVDIRKADRVLSIVEPGSVFGEMGLIDGLPRNADAIATTHCRIALIREGQFMSMVGSTPHFALSIMRLFTDRLRRNADS